MRSPAIEARAPDLAQLQVLARAFAARLVPGTCVHLRGALGAGKTAFVGAVLAALGHRGPAKSPTFTLVEPYEFGSWRVFHFDLYRLQEPEELEFLGIRDYIEGEAVCFIEWPERAHGRLPAPDVDVSILAVNHERILRFEALSERGMQVLSGLRSATT